MYTPNSGKKQLHSFTAFGAAFALSYDWVVEISCFLCNGINSLAEHSVVLLYMWLQHMAILIWKVSMENSLSKVCVCNQEAGRRALGHHMGCVHSNQAHVELHEGT